MRSIVIDGLTLIVEEVRYSPNIVDDLNRDSYEGDERGVLNRFLQPGDRVLEIGTALGLVTMCAARLVGDANVFSFGANPDLADAERNFAESDTHRSTSIYLAGASSRS